MKRGRLDSFQNYIKILDRATLESSLVKIFYNILDLNQYGGNVNTFATYWGFTLEKEILYLTPVDENLEYDDIKADLIFLNKSTVELENIVKSNSIKYD